MKYIKVICSLSFILIFTSGCSKFLDREIESNYKEEEVFVNYDRIQQAGFGVYAFIYNRFGFSRIQNAMLASASDEADHADAASDIHKFNTGTWTAASNPEDCWAHFYQGIRRANLFLEKSTDYRQIIYRDTTDPANKANYEANVQDITWLRAEVKVLRALYYFELIKRYGGVPIIDRSTYSDEELAQMPRNTFDSCVKYVSKECDAAFPELKTTWVGFSSEKWRGRITQGVALALKARLLLYVASPLHNPANDVSKWAAAAAAAHKVIELGRYALHNNYTGLFRLGNGADSNPEVIFAIQSGASNNFERLNYPVGYTQGGQGSTAPSQNLVDAYEMKPTGMMIHEPGSGYNPDNPYANRDPRLGFSILTNNTTFKTRPVEAWVGGLDGLGKLRATTTGYYLRKFIDESLNLEQNTSSVHVWMLFRYAEVLLNYAEAMNEAFGPEVSQGYSMTAKAAVDMVRQRTGVVMPVLPPGLSQQEMRERIHNERRVELAFEEHRFFDVRRWKIAGETENMPVMAMRIDKNTDGTFKYKVIKAEDRTFSEKMYFYPIPEAEVLKSKGNLVQNNGW
ncbi:MAG: RagB/SusD family nutrient uptake outer membrane protein [Niabella sp.]